jgi:hypothetical protein
MIALALPAPLMTVLALLAGILGQAVIVDGIVAIPTGATGRPPKPAR